ncbi:ROK family protein [Pseudonocardia eucalypti]|uniref:ROK family protein n=1 Tax=Pseudonocardia eucalypti TaxID=648755 RepID=A0ABP9Q7C4_9PSEU|nr:putative NBD/HSP70 family sugar kinase [Pseudonocardia eucalypti]
MSTAGEVLAALRADGPLTREELRVRVGLSRVTLVERLDALHRLGLVRAAGYRESSGGRRAELLAVNDIGRTALVADVGQRHTTLAVVDLAGTVLAQAHTDLPDGHHPDRTLPALLAAGRRLLAETGRESTLSAVGLSVPGQIDHRAGVTHAPPTMPDWGGVPLRTPFASLEVPVLLENDANALAFGAYRGLGNPAGALVGVKVGTGIGAGVVISGAVHRGETGCAGEIGHIRVEGRDERCDCGRRGCVAALASGRAVVRELRAHGVRSAAEALGRVRAGDPDAVRVTSAAGRLVGSVLATVVTIVNPRHIRVGGAFGVLPPFLSGLRETVLAGAHTHALDGLSVEACPPAENTTLLGIAALAADEHFAPSTVDRLVR